MYHPAADDEITGIARYLDQQLDALRASVVGLTEAQAREQPCRSTLSLGGLLKHVVHGMRGATRRLTGDLQSPPSLGPDEFAAYQAAFALTVDETTAGVLEDFDAARADLVAAVAAVDPAAPTLEPAAPWHGLFDERPAHARFLLVHLVEEYARHAGHADLLREQLDGVSIPRIVLSLEGAPASDFFEPYVPEPGTIGA